MHFTWFEYFLKIDPHNVYVAASVFTTGLIILLSFVGRAALGSGETAVLPAEKFSIKGIFEFITEFIDSLCEMLFGHHGARYIPHFASIFTFILVSNLLGLIPGFTSSTANINSAFAIAIVSFLFYNVLGLAHGGWNYIAHFFGPLRKWYWAWLMVFMLAIEVISHSIRPISLSVRLSANLTADHAVLSAFTELTKAVIPVVFYMMGTLVCVLQAFIFTLISMVYVMLATADDH